MVEGCNMRLLFKKWWNKVFGTINGSFMFRELFEPEYSKIIASKYTGELRVKES